MRLGPGEVAPPPEILDFAPILIGYLGTDQRYRFVNARYAEVLQLPTSEIVGRHVEDVLGKAAYTALSGYVRQVLAGECVQYQRWVTLRDGRRRYWRTRYEPHVEDDEVQGVFVYVQDITEKKMAEAALRASDERFRAIFENAAVGIALVAPEGRWLDVNDRLSEELGYTRAELLRLTFQDITHPDDLEADLRQSELLLAGEIDSYKMDKRYIRKDGSVMWARLTASTVRDGEAVLCGLAIIENITPQREAEDALRRLNMSLESRIEERTAELVDLNRELDAFNYSVSHDLRAPLRGIDGFSRALLEDYASRLDSTGRGYLERVRSNARRMGALIDSMLQLSRISRSELRRREVDLTALAHEVVGNLPERPREVEIEDGLAVWGDEGLLRIALGNLLENAWKFSGGTPEPRVEVGRERHGDDTVFYVRDNGSGFDPRYADRLFVPFQRLHTDAEFEGQGIGLATVQRIVHRHGGRIWAEGEVGRGAVFYFTLPVRPAAERPSAS